MSDSLPFDMEIRGYFPGVIGKITEIHGLYYQENWGFDITFEAQVGSELSEFVKAFEHDRDGIWIATIKGDFAGSVIIDGREAATDGARLRWFIVEPRIQGKGIGKVLIDRALAFCRQRVYNKIYLWTFEGLDAARAIYEQAGFRLEQEHSVAQWGQEINEQMFQLSL